MTGCTSISVPVVQHAYLSVVIHAMSESRSVRESQKFLFGPFCPCHLPACWHRPGAISGQWGDFRCIGQDQNKFKGYVFLILSCRVKTIFDA